MKRLVKEWECDSTEQLQNCLDTTDWNILYSDDVNECVETVSSYIQFWENNIVPSKEVTCYPNNKPWLTKELKQKFIAKRQYIYHKDRLQLKILQKDLDKEIQQCKQNYKRKLEANFSEGNSRQAWKGLQAITGYKTKPKSFSNIYIVPMLKNFVII